MSLFLSSASLLVEHASYVAVVTLSYLYMNFKELLFDEHATEIHGLVHVIVMPGLKSMVLV